MKIDVRGFDDHAGFIDGRYTRDDILGTRIETVCVQVGESC